MTSPLVIEWHSIRPSKLTEIGVQLSKLKPCQTDVPGKALPFETLKLSLKKTQLRWLVFAIGLIALRPTTSLFVLLCWLLSKRQTHAHRRRRRGRRFTTSTTSIQPAKAYEDESAMLTGPR